MTRDNLKHVIISILIGAGVAFFSTLFSELATFFKTYGSEMVAGGVSSLSYLARNLKS